MKSHEFIQAAADMLSAFGNKEEPQVDITATGKLHQVEPELDDHTEPGEQFIAPLQQKLELLKKAVDVDSYYDADRPGGAQSSGPEAGEESVIDPVDDMKRLAGIMFNAEEDTDGLEG